MQPQPQGRTVAWRHLFPETFDSWQRDKAQRLGAALAYYTVFSIAPLLVIAVAVAGFALGDEAASGQLENQMRQYLGADGAKGIQALVVAAREPKAGILATVLGIAALVFGASGVFYQLKDALNTIFNVEIKPGRGARGFVTDWIKSILMVACIGVLLLALVVASAVLTGFVQRMGERFPISGGIAHLLDMLVSVLVVTFLFGLIFRYLPNVKIGWRDVWPGACLSSVLFTLGKYFFGLYLGYAGISSTFGAAGSIVILLVWTYYSAQILFFGAEFSRSYARLHGRDIPPSDDAVSVTAAQRAEQGLAPEK